MFIKLTTSAHRVREGKTSTGNVCGSRNYHNNNSRSEREITRHESSRVESSPQGCWTLFWRNTNIIFNIQHKFDQLCANYRLNQVYSREEREREREITDGEFLQMKDAMNCLYAYRMKLSDVLKLAPQQLCII